MENLPQALEQSNLVFGHRCESDVLLISYTLHKDNYITKYKTNDTVFFLH